MTADQDVTRETGDQQSAATDSDAAPARATKGGRSSSKARKTPGGQKAQVDDPPAGPAHTISPQPSLTISYEPDGATLEKFLLAKTRVNLIQGPWGSGKSSASIVKLIMNALNQRPGPDGIRRRRTYVVRNTYDDLLRTTIASWKVMLPEHKFGPIKLSKPYRQHIRIGDLDWEIVFLALDDEDDRKKLLSAEMSDIWFNEFREILRSLMDDADGRIGRFPSAMQGGCDNPMLIGDTNAPPDDHWFPIMSGQSPMPLDMTDDDRRALVKPESWSIFLQPPALIEQRDADGRITGYLPNPLAENVKYLPEGYYEKMVAGKTSAWIRVNVLNRPGRLVAGEPVFPQFVVARHVAPKPLEPIAGHPLLIGQDFGRTPAAVIGQCVFGRWRILYEKAVPTGKSMGAREFAKLLKLDLAQRYPGFLLKVWGDPAGQNLAEADDISPFLMFRAEDIPIYPAPSNDPAVRINAVIEALNDMMDGEPRFLVSPSCTRLIAALEGEYQFPKSDKESPLKNHASHIADALQYLMLGGGEGRSLLHNRPRESSGSNVVQMRGRRQGNAFSRRGLTGFSRGK